MDIPLKSYQPTLWQRMKGNTMFMVGISILGTLILGAILLPWIYPNYEQTSLEHTLAQPGKMFPFGTDSLGRCMLARTIQGIRLSLLIAVTATLIDVLVGLLWSTVALSSGKKVAFLMMRITEILFSIPRIPVIILLLVIFDHGILPLILAMTLTGWIPIARIIYGQFLLLENKEFVLSAKTMNASTFHILKKHLLPNTLTPIISTLIFTIPGAIYTEAFISFLGLGIQPPQASLGTLVKEGINAIDYYPWLFFIPSFFMITLSISFNLIGEGAKALFIEENSHA
ncbi:Oligopeptide transport system permease protein oppC,oligopeptide ABC transporter permease OppC,ABC-type antimicrobial peptide transport system, permease component,nickel ABC transporter, permease subunit NikC,Binding-protein-dependent transport system inner membrane component [Chlamydia poikilotherma]|uniref:ABC transmembrane type-1 domain-containing protein n=1 Tax=Chlamydia poikilotherma TaxID=1967783 RepID=A0A3B0QGZ6_9CHLA|nr:ABC transporter permease [Chlamydia poikilotherma]SYX09072.1 Oligopeptide transport system permease protein oppC,oligopeptide ABC transporter permease OppC,ABC-type antimicrobial peptide transport system, permease component,nickel ABC transporter, permease subunit NikC,Binding-protein-dependent transport system inner membrane component [Chlamydia poikilotherma]